MKQGFFSSDSTTTQAGNSQPDERLLKSLLAQYNTGDLNVALRRAASKGASMDVECMVTHFNADVNSQSASNQFTALDWALKGGLLSRDAFELLYQRQQCDSLAKRLWSISRDVLTLPNKDDLLAHAIARHCKVDQRLLIEKFDANLDAARLTLMTRDFPEDSRSDKFMKVYSKHFAEEMGKVMTEAYRVACPRVFAVALESGTPGQKRDVGQMMSSAVVAMSAELNKEAARLAPAAQQEALRKASGNVPEMGLAIQLMMPTLLGQLPSAVQSAMPAVMEHTLQSMQDITEALRHQGQTFFEEMSMGEADEPSVASTHGMN